MSKRLSSSNFGKVYLSSSGQIYWEFKYPKRYSWKSKGVTRSKLKLNSRRYSYSNAKMSFWGTLLYEIISYAICDFIGNTSSYLLARYRAVIPIEWTSEFFNTFLPLVNYRYRSKSAIVRNQVLSEHFKFVQTSIIQSTIKILVSYFIWCPVRGLNSDKCCIPLSLIKKFSIIFVYYLFLIFSSSAATFYLNLYSSFSLSILSIPVEEGSQSSTDCICYVMF
jgi:hypothetical protein